MKNSLTKNRRGLTSTDLKTIALVLMVLDHLHYFFEFTGMVPVWFSMLGRLSAPLFLFCTAEGFAHTHDRRAYVFRIWLIGGGMGAVEFFMQYAGALLPKKQSKATAGIGAALFTATYIPLMAKFLPFLLNREE